MPGAALYRQPVSARRDYALALAMEGTRVAHRRQEAGQKHRSMAAPRRGRFAARDRMDLGARPCRPHRERARRYAGALGYPSPGRVSGPGITPALAVSVSADLAARLKLTQGMA